MLRTPEYGEVVYCEANGQVYMVEGHNSFNGKFQLKNLLNEGPTVEIPESQLREIPDNWGTKNFYEKMAKEIVDKRKKL